MTHPVDILVLGSGPAALTIAAALADRACSVRVVAPEPEAPWRPNYCLWAEELPAELDAAVDRRWEGALVRTPYGDHTIDRPYTKLGTAAWQRRLLDGLRAKGVSISDAKAIAVARTDDEVRVEAEHGKSFLAHVVVDATGAGSPFVSRVHRKPPAYQRAYGLLLDAPDHGFNRERAVLMDFNPADPDDPDPSSFLYVLPLDDGRVFVEETSLAGRPAVEFDLLQQRLEHRLVGWGLHDRPRLSVEHCHIPMGLGLPTAKQDVVPFGAAASMVHPASGYLQARVLRKAPLVAIAIERALREGGGRLATDRGNDALWTSGERKAWELYAVGLESLVKMTAEETASFFHFFFTLPMASWAGLLGGTLPPSALRSVMSEHFFSLPLRVQWRLVRSSVTGGAAPFARSLMPQGAP
ncbi:MAG: lycopene cyclase family protein [Myxococcota bacterium]